MDLWLFAVSMAAAGLSTLLFLPWLIRSLRSTTLVGKDLNKPSHPTVPEMGGVAVILGFYVGVAVITVLAPDQALSGFSKFFFAALSAALGAGVVGLIDDMFHLRQRTKALLPFILTSPVPAYTMAGSEGATATAPIVPPKKPSDTGFHVCPPSVVFQTPPAHL